MSGSRTRNRQDDYKDGYNNANTTAVMYPTILAALVTALASAITTAVTNATIAQLVSVNAKMHSSVIDSYESRSMNLRTKESNYQWYIVTKTEPGWSLITVTMENVDKLMDLFE